MKKSVSLLLSMLMIFSFVCVGYTVAAEGNVYTVGATVEGANFTTLADAVASVSDGDTIQLVEDITAKNVSINKSITIDTNGFTWTGGTSSKANCATIKSGATVQIINSKRAGQITSDVDKFDIVCNSVKNQGVFMLDNNANLVMKNIAANSTNTYVNNLPCIVYFSSAATSKLTTENCYLTSDNWGAVGASSGSAMQISAANSIFGGLKCSVFYTVSASSTVNSVMNFDNCTFLSPISACNANNATAVDNATSTFKTVTYNFKNCTATSLFAPSATAVFDGNCAFETAKSGVVVTAAEGVSLYADAEGTTNVTSGEALAADSPVYSIAAATTYQIYVDGVMVDEIAAGADYTLPKGTADGFICYTDGTNYFAENAKLTPEKNLSLTSVTVGSFNMVKGAAMRVNEKTGIRFYTNVDTDKVAQLIESGATISMGTLIAPENLLGGEDLTLSTNGNNCLNVPYISGVEDNDWFTDVIGGTDFCGMVGSIVTIKDTNINRKFVGRGYITVTIGGITKTVYADYAVNEDDSNPNIANNTRSIAYIANAVRNDSGKAEFYEAHKSVIDKYANEYSADSEF